MKLTKDAQHLISKNARQVSTYIEILRPTLERSGQLPTEPLGKKHRGESNPPISEALHDIVEANRDEIRLLEPLLKAAMNSRAPVNFYRKDLMLLEVWASPGCQLRWPEPRQEALVSMCRLIAYRLWATHPEAELWCATTGRTAQRKLGNTEPSEDDGVEEAKDSPAKTMREHSENVMKARTHRKLRAIYMTWETTKRERGVGSEEAKRIMYAERDIHPKMTERAITEVGADSVA